MIRCGQRVAKDEDGLCGMSVVEDFAGTSGTSILISRCRQRSTFSNVVCMVHLSDVERIMNMRATECNVTANEKNELGYGD